MIIGAGSKLRARRLVAAVVFAFVLLTGSVAVAQEDVHGKYKVGEVVECDPLSGTGEFKRGTVVEVNGKGDKLTCCRYRVKFENDDPLWADGRLCFDRFIRPLGSAKPDKEQAGTGTGAPEGGGETKLGRKPGGEAEDFTRLADREILDCPVEQKQVARAARPQPELLKKVIRCLYERRAPAGVTGAKTVDISAFVMGTPRRWRPLDDIGSGNTNTTVYPIKVTWTEKTFYESFTQVIDSISIFNCYVNAVGEWECGLGQRLKESDVKRIPRQQ